METKIQTQIRIVIDDADSCYDADVATEYYDGDKSSDDDGRDDVPMKKMIMTAMMLTLLLLLNRKMI